MISEGRSLAAVDYAAGYPEGIEVFQSTSLFKEYTAGYLHGLPFFRNIPLPLFLEYFTWFFSSLSIFGIFFICLLLIKDPLIALLTTAYYVAALPAVIGTVNGSFVPMVFVLPFIVLHIYFVLKSIKGKDKLNPVIAGFLLFIIIGSWDLSPLYFLLFISYIIFKYLFTRDTDDLKNRFFIFMAAQMFFLLLAGFFIPYLRVRLFLLSLPMVVCYSFSLVLIIDKFRNLNRALKIALFIGFVTGLYLVFPASKDYTPAYSVLIYKIKYFSGKPSSPGKLPFAIRCLWTESFQSPSFFQALFYFFTYLLWGGVGFYFLIYHFIKKKLDIHKEFILYIIFGFLGLYIFFRQFGIFLIIGLTLSSNLGLYYLRNYFKKRYFIFIFILVLCIALEAYKTGFLYKNSSLTSRVYKRIILKEESRFTFRDNAVGGLVNWIKNETPGRSRFLCPYLFSGPLLLYTDRIVIVNPAFESVLQRNKIKEINSALYDNEEQFYNICRKYEVDYYVYIISEFLDTSLYSTRYLVDNIQPDDQEIAFAFQFQPERLKYFKLVYQNEIFHVYRVISKGFEKINPGQLENYIACYDERIYKQMDLSTADFFYRWNSAYNMKTTGDYYFKKKQLAAAEGLYEQSLDIFPFYPQMLISSAKIDMVWGKLDSAYAKYQKSLSITYSVPAHYGIAVINLRRGNIHIAEQELKRVIIKDPDYQPALLDMIYLYKQKGQYAKAIQWCKKAIVYFPDNKHLQYEMQDLYNRIKN